MCRSRAFTLMLLCSILLPERAAPQNRGRQASTFKFDTEIQLEGTLTERTFYGPPGFGESPATDVRDRVLVVRLARPISAQPTADAKARDSVNLDAIENVH